MRLPSVVLWLSIAVAAPAQPPPLDVSGLDDPEPSVRAEAAMRIGQAGAGEAAVGPLREALQDANPAVRAAAAEALGLTGRSARAVGPSLRERLADPDPKVRSAAAMALGRVDDSEASALALERMLREESEAELRRWAIRGLEAMGPSAAPALPALRDAALDIEPGVAVEAARALGRVPSADNDASVRVLLDAIALGQPHVEAAALASLGALARSPEVVVPTLAQIAADPSRHSYTRSAAVQALGGFGPAAEAAIPDLARLLDHPAPDFQRVVRRSLVQIDRGAGGKSHDELVTRYASFASLPGLSKPAPAPADAAHDVLRLASIVGTSSDAAVRQQALDALAALGANAKPALDVITRALEDDRPAVRQAARRALVAIGREATPALVTALGSERPEVRIEAADAIAELGDRATAALEPLMQAAGASSGPDRASLLHALAGLARMAPEATYPLFLTVLREGGEGIDIAAQAMHQMGCAAAGAAPALEHIVRSGEAPEHARASAVRALVVVACEGRDRAARALAARLGEILADPGPAVFERNAILYGLPALESSDPVVLSLSETLLVADEPLLRQQALRIVQAAGDKAAGRAPAVIARLGDPMAKVRMSAALALGAFPSAASLSARPLLRALDDPDETVRWAAAFALGDLPDAAPLSVPVFQRLLDDPSDRLREMAIRGLIHLDAVTPEALAKIAAAAADPSPHVQRAIAFARAQGVLKGDN